MASESVPNQKNSNRLIPLARVVRQHGLLRDGQLTLKADLFHLGGEIFQKRKLLYYSKKLEGPYTKLELSSHVKSYGGAFGQAKGILITLPAELQVPIGSYLAIPREDFPPLNEGEFYLCDLLDREVLDENSQSFGKVTGFRELSRSDLRNVNLQLANGMEFPLVWADFDSAEGQKAFAEGKLLVPSLSEWKI